MDAAAIALRFNDHINNREPERMAELMSDDHILIDTVGNRVEGKARNKENWESFFKAFPYYENVFEEISVNGHTVTMSGYSLCSHESLNNVKAVWTAEIYDSKIKLWKVKHSDIPNRKE